MNKLEIPDLTRWRAGELPDEDMFNQLQDAHEFMLDPPTCKLRRTSSQTIGTGTFTAISWQEATEDNCKPFGIGYETAMWDPGNNTRVTARVGGWYEVNYTVIWTSTTDDHRRLHAFDLNDGPESVWTRGRMDRWHLNNQTMVNVTWPVFMNVDDYIKLYVLHFIGSSTSVISPGPELGRQTSIKVKWVSL